MKLYEIMCLLYQGKLLTSHDGRKGTDGRGQDQRKKQIKENAIKLLRETSAGRMEGWTLRIIVIS